MNIRKEQCITGKTQDVAQWKDNENATFKCLVQANFGKTEGRRYKNKSNVYCR